MSILSTVSGVFGPSKYLWIAVALLSVGLLGAGYALKREIEAKSALAVQLKDANDALRFARLRQIEDGKALVARDAKIASERRKSEAEKRTLEKALERNRAWTDQPIPKEVLDALPDPSVPIPVVPGTTSPVGMRQSDPSEGREGEDTRGPVAALPLPGVGVADDRGLPPSG